MSQEDQGARNRAEPAVNWAWNPSPPSEVRRIDPTQLPPEEVARLMAASPRRPARPAPRA
jgi:hypothetical protein